ncbi:MAG: NUDIX hydrolase [Chromatiales bacterium]|jgi:8-oxo-dGTP pyrophosphatase MutT (NUDIX family)|nr:NUDIX hydrolase [Chromatiales bacterium]
MTGPNRTVVFQGRVIDISIDTVTLPNGVTLDLEQIHHPGGAAVVAVNDSDQVCLLRQYRYAADGWLWELPAGKVDNAEPHAVTALRELAEEAGVEASVWHFLGSVISSPGVFREWIHLYLAQGLTHISASPEEAEIIEVHWVPLATAIDWALDGTITDAKTIIGLHRADFHLSNRQR